MLKYFQQKKLPNSLEIKKKKNRSALRQGARVSGSCSVQAGGEGGCVLGGTGRLCVW